MAFDLLHPRPLHLRLAHRLSHLAIALVPLLLPLPLPRFHLFELLLRLGQRLGRHLDLRLQRIDGRFDLGQLRLVLADLLPRRLDGRQRLLPVALLPGDQFALVQNRLLHPRDLAAELVEERLHGVEVLARFDALLAQPFEFRLMLAQLGHPLLQRRPHRLNLGVAGVELARQRIEPQIEQLGPGAAFLLLQHLVALRRLSLPLEVVELLGDLVAQVVEPVEVLGRVAHPRLGLLAPLLVFGDAGGLFEIDPQLLRLGLDQARDHPLLDNGVGTWPQAGTEKDVGDVAAAAAGAVEKVVGLAVAGNAATHRDFVEAGVFAANAAVAVVEHQLDRRLRHRLARRRAIEDDIVHRLPAQMLGRRLTHDPAYRVDDIRFATAVRPDDAHQIAGQIQRGGIDERLEAGEFDLVETHRAVTTTETRTRHYRRETRK